ELGFRLITASLCSRQPRASKQDIFGARSRERRTHARTSDSGGLAVDVRLAQCTIQFVLRCAAAESNLRQPLRDAGRQLSTTIRCVCTCACAVNILDSAPTDGARELGVCCAELCLGTSQHRRFDVVAKL